MRVRSITIAAVACATALVTWLAPSSAAALDENVGFRVGANGRFQPGLRFVGAYQSNVYRAEAAAEADFTLLLQPHLRYLLRSDAAAFTLTGDYYLKKYLGAFVDHTADPVGHKDLDIFVNYDIGLDLVTRPQGKLSFLLADRLSRLSREFDNTDRVFHRYSLMDRLSNDTHIGIEGRPGKSLKIQGLFHFDLGRYTGAATQGIGAGANRIVYGQAFDLYGSVRVAWRFFPKTEALLEADFGHVLWSPDYQESIAAQADPSLTSLNQYDSDHWRVWAGVQGKFSRKIAVQAMIGYGNAYFPESPAAPQDNLRQADGLLGKAQLHWTPLMTQRITVGFLRDYRYLYFSNYYITTSPYLRYSGQIAGLVLPSAELAYMFREIAGDVDRDDHELRARAGVDFQLTEFFKIGAHYTFWSILASSAGDEPTFVDHQIGLGIEFGY